MVRIRLARVGRKNAPAYRIVAIDRKFKRDGKFIELIGNYNPTEDPKKVNYKKDRYEYWISVGAQPSAAVRKLIRGTYEFKPYDRSNEQKKEGQEGSNVVKKDTEKQQKSEDEHKAQEIKTPSNKQVKA